MTGVATPTFETPLSNRKRPASFQLGQQPHPHFRFWGGGLPSAGSTPSTTSVTKVNTLHTPQLIAVRNPTTSLALVETCKYYTYLHTQDYAHPCVLIYALPQPFSAPPPPPLLNAATFLKTSILCRVMAGCSAVETSGSGAFDAGAAEEGGGFRPASAKTPVIERRQSQPLLRGCGHSQHTRNPLANLPCRTADVAPPQFREPPPSTPQLAR
jgi:hypothetical protein